MPTGVTNRHVARRTPLFKGTVHIYRSLESSDLSHLLFLEVRHTFLVKFIIIEGCKVRVNVVTGRYLSLHLRVIFCPINYVKLVIHTYSIACLPNVQWRVIHLCLRWQYLSFTSGVRVNESNQNPGKFWVRLSFTRSNCTERSLNRTTLVVRLRSLSVQFYRVRLRRTVPWKPCADSRVHKNEQFFC